MFAMPVSMTTQLWKLELVQKALGESIVCFAYSYF